MNRIKQFMEDDNKLLTLTGPAGSGKTTLLRMVAAEIETAVFCAPTNKAAAQLRKLGFKKATTLDKVLHKKQYAGYFRDPTPEEIEFWKANDHPILDRVEVEEYEVIDNAAPGLLVVLDEASMSNLEEIHKLTSLYGKVFAVGDGFQLPPVEGREWFQQWQHDIVLNKIVRTAEGSKLAELCQRVRNRDPNWDNHDYGDEVVFLYGTPKKLPLDALPYLKDADIVLAFKNDTCDTFNVLIREERDLMRSDDQTQPVSGDWLLAWSKDEKLGIYKSERYLVHSSTPFAGGYRVKFLVDGALQIVPINKAKLQRQKPERDIYVRDCLPFSYGHCITVHKSQGGEWDSVFVIASDKAKSGKYGMDYWNWLYTAVSRARKRLVVLL